MILPAYTLEKKEERERERTEREQREKKEQPKKQIRVPKREKKIFDNHEFSLQKKNWKKKRKKKKMNTLQFHLSCHHVITWVLSLYS